MRFARGADVLILPHAIPQSARGGAAALHIRPGEIAEAAGKVQPRRLVLNHHMNRALEHLDHTLRRVKRRWGGTVVVAQDLTCIPLD